MVRTEKDLAKAILRRESVIDLHNELIGGVEKIKDPSAIAWASVTAALASSAFFWGSPCAAVLGLTVGLPAILAVCGGVGGVVFLTLGASGTICAFKLLMQAKSIDVLNQLRDNYTLENNKLRRK